MIIIDTKRYDFGYNPNPRTHESIAAAFEHKSVLYDQFGRLYPSRAGIFKIGKPVNVKRPWRAQQTIGNH